MNQVQFETSKVFGVFVKIDDFKEMKRAGMNLTGNFRIQYETTRGTVSTFTVDGIDENYKLQGFVSNLTDEQKEGVVEDFGDKYGFDAFENYNKDEKEWKFIKASESFASLLTSLNVLLVNPYQEQMKGMTFSNDHKNKWEIAQQNVGQWCLLTCDK